MPLIQRGNYFAAYNIDDPADWDLIYSEINREPQSYFPDKQKFNSTIKDYFTNICKAAIIEFRYADKDFRDTYYNFFSKKFAKYQKDCIRLNFFSRGLQNTQDLWKLQEINDEVLKETGGECGTYIGNVVLRPLTHGNISRSFINATCVDTPPFVACRTEYETNVLGSRFKVSAFPFMNQDTDVAQCAMTAMWMAMRYYSERYSNYKEIYPYEISQLSRDISSGRILPAYRGMSIFHLTEAFGNYGFEPVVYVKKAFIDEDKKIDGSGVFLRYLHYYIESGLPLIIGFPQGAAGRPGGHAVTVFGHLKDNVFHSCAGSTHCNTPGIVDSCCYCKGYVINDDNWMPYQTLLKRGVDAAAIETRRLFLSDFRIDEIEAFVVPLYEKIYLYAEHADFFARQILLDQQLGFSFSQLSQHKLKSGEKIVLRVYLTSSRSYKYKRRHESTIGSGIERLYIDRPMPKFIWVAEISTEEMYLRGKVMGEIIFDATANKDDRHSAMYIHYPGILIVNDRDVIGNFVRYRILTTSVDDGIFYDIFSSNLKPGGRR